MTFWIERVKKSIPVILSEAKDLRSFFRLNEIRKTAGMLRFAQHDRIGFFHTFTALPRDVS
jgi:hypothetical protein